MAAAKLHIVNEVKSTNAGHRQTEDQNPAVSWIAPGALSPRRSQAKRLVRKQLTDLVWGTGDLDGGVGRTSGS